MKYTWNIVQVYLKYPSSIQKYHKYPSNILWKHTFSIFEVYSILVRVNSDNKNLSAKQYRQLQGFVSSSFITVLTEKLLSPSAPKVLINMLYPLPPPFWLRIWLYEFTCLLHGYIRFQCNKLTFWSHWWSPQWRVQS